MKKILFALSLLSLVACHKKDDPAPTPIIHSVDALLIDKWNFSYNNHSNVATFSNDSLIFSFASPTLPSCAKSNAAYTSHDTIFINSSPQFTYYVADNRASLTSISSNQNFVLSKVDTAQQNHNTATP